MSDLDNKDKIKKLDSQNLAGSILELGKQCEQVKGEIEGLEFDRNLSGLPKIVVMGMGGSTLGAHILKAVFFDELKVSFEYVNGYHVSGYVDSNTLVILSSYSGTTEEAVAAQKEAKEKGAKMIAISSGGELGKLVSSGEIQGYIFEPKYNPSGQPRMGLGYSILSQILILSKLGYIKFSDDDYQAVLKAIKKINGESSVEVEKDKNKAKQTAEILHEKVPFLLASEHLMGNIHAFANQINENGKVLSAYYALPEADHHLIEGLPSTESIHDNAVFFFLNSGLYSERVQKRYPITQELIDRQHIKSIEIKPQGKTKIEQSFEFLTFGSWVSFYLAMLSERDPSPIPNVDFLKSEIVKD